LLGVLNPGVVYTLNLMGLSRVSASVTTLLWAAEPLMILILAATLLREPVSGRLLAVLAVGVVGVALVAGLAEGFHGSGSEPVGILLLLLAVLCCAFYTVACRSLSGSADPLVLVTIQQTAGLCWSVAFLSAGTPYGGWSEIANIALPQLAAAVLSGLMYYAAAYWLYLAALRFCAGGRGRGLFQRHSDIRSGARDSFSRRDAYGHSMGRSRRNHAVRDRPNQAHAMIEGRARKTSRLPQIGIVGYRPPTPQKPRSRRSD
jgi:hypothetical protein